jgi:hypothetical protein
MISLPYMSLLPSFRFKYPLPLGGREGGLKSCAPPWAHSTFFPVSPRAQTVGFVHGGQVRLARAD